MASANSGSLLLASTIAWLTGDGGSIEAGSCLAAATGCGAGGITGGESYISQLRSPATPAAASMPGTQAVIRLLMVDVEVFSIADTSRVSFMEHGFIQLVL